MKLITLDDDDYGGCADMVIIKLCLTYIDPKGRKLGLATPLGKVDILSNGQKSNIIQ